MKINILILGLVSVVISSCGVDDCPLKVTFTNEQLISLRPGQSALTFHSHTISFEGIGMDTVRVDDTLSFMDYKAELLIDHSVIKFAHTGDVLYIGVKKPGDVFSYTKMECIELNEHTKLLELKTWDSEFMEDCSDW